MGLRVSMALAVVITTPVTIGVVTGVCCFMPLVYLTPLRESIRKRLLSHKGVMYYEGMAKRLPADIRAYFVRMGRTGGKLGGKIRAEKLSPERRKEIARNAIAARWAKRAELP